ncbi:unnamed protein product, partial [Chrysoparadoxa australica]
MACIGCPDGGFLQNATDPMPAVAPPSLPEDVCTCPANTYGDGAFCTACPLQSSSPPGSLTRAECLCDAGTFWDASMACIGCPDGGFLQNATDPMPAVAPPSLPEDVCTCPANTYGDGAFCTACPLQSS